MKLVINENIEPLFEMSNVRGNKVKVPHKLNFSFYFSPKDATESKDIVHGLRVKPLFNPEKMNYSNAGTLKLHGDWEYIPGKEDRNIDSKSIAEMKKFFEDYKILFAGVWEKVLPPDALYDYFRGTITFNELLAEYEFYDDYKEEMNELTTVKELMEFIGDNNIYNTWNK